MLLFSFSFNQGGDDHDDFSVMLLPRILKYYNSIKLFMAVFRKVSEHSLFQSMRCSQWISEKGIIDIQP